MVATSIVVGALIAAPFVWLGLRGYDASGGELAVGSFVFGLFPMVMVFLFFATSRFSPWHRTFDERWRAWRSSHPLPRARVVRTVERDG